MSNASPADNGPAHLSEFLVARRQDRARPIWIPLKGNDIAAIRRLYDAGLVELCQRRVGDTFLLYAIPRRHKAHRAPFFTADGKDFRG